MEEIDPHEMYAVMRQFRDLAQTQPDQVRSHSLACVFSFSFHISSLCVEGWFGSHLPTERWRKKPLFNPSTKLLLCYPVYTFR